jgi:uncharacterized protein (TIGR02145 family)
MISKVKMQVYITILIMFSALTTISCEKENKPLFTLDQPVTDIDGNVYNTIKINNQIWMAENLKTKKYNNGDLIGTTIPPNSDISNEPSPKYEWAYDGNESNMTIYGLLYTWYSVNDDRKLCPTGWHVPTDTEWKILTEFLGGDSIAGGKLKQTGTTYYFAPNLGATNESGFTALPSGLRYATGVFYSLGDGPIWWTSTEFDNNNAIFRSLGYSGIAIRRDYFPKNNGMAIRCIKD